MSVLFSHTVATFIDKEEVNKQTILVIPIAQYAPNEKKRDMYHKQDFERTFIQVIYVLIGSNDLHVADVRFTKPKKCLELNSRGPYGFMWQHVA